MEVFLQLALAALLGGLVGLEREYRKKEAGLWVVAAIGVAVGARLYLWASFVAALTIVILFGLMMLERKIFGHKDDEEETIET